MRKFFCALFLLLVLFSANAGSESNFIARVAFLADTHVNLRTNDAGVTYNNHFNKAIGAINAAKVDLVLIAGDLTDNGQPEQMDLFAKRAKEFKAPVLFVAGNHDVGNAPNPDGKKSVKEERVALFCKKLGPAFFAREEAGVRVIGINSCIFGTGFAEELEQWKFLETELAKPHAEPTLLVEHHPLFLNDADEAANSIWNVNPAQRKRLIALLEQGGVRTVLTGHMHRLIVNRLHGILYLSDTACAYGAPRGAGKAAWILLSVPQTGEPRFEVETLD